MQSGVVAALGSGCWCRQCQYDAITTAVTASGQQTHGSQVMNRDQILLPQVLLGARCSLQEYDSGEFRSTSVSVDVSACIGVGFFFLLLFL